MVGIAGENISLVLEVHCAECLDSEKFSINPMDWPNLSFSHVPVNVRMINDGWVYNREENVWVCFNCTEAAKES